MEMEFGTENRCRTPSHSMLASVHRAAVGLTRDFSRVAAVRYGQQRHLFPSTCYLWIDREASQSAANQTVHVFQKRAVEHPFKIASICDRNLL